MAATANKTEYGTIQSVIISAAMPENARAQADLLAAGILCRSSGKRPCGECASCRKIEHGAHPDVITVRRTEDAKGALKKEITVDQIREVSVDAYILPNEADRKVYIIEEADRMNLNAQNAALKLLEEPPNGAVLLLCVTNPSALLPTVRSRCTEMTVNGGEKPFQEETEARTDQYLHAAASGSRAELVAWCYQNENMSWEDFRDFLLCARERITDMLCSRRPSDGLTEPELLNQAELMETCLAYRQVNVSVKLLLGRIAASCPKRVSDEQHT